MRYRCGSGVVRHDVGAGIHEGHHFRKKLGLILQVGIDNQGTVASTMLQSRGQCHLMTIIAHQVDRNDMGVALRQHGHHRQGGIGRAVIDQHKLVRVVHGLPTDGTHAPVQFRQARSFVIAGRDNRQGAIRANALGGCRLEFGHQKVRQLLRLRLVKNWKGKRQSGNDGEIGD